MKCNSEKNSPAVQDAIIHRELTYLICPKGGGFLQVAGHDVVFTHTYFVRPVVDGKIVADDKKAIFYASFYEFDGFDYDALAEDLIPKLSDLYGTPETVEDADGKTYTVWKGVNDTEVALCENRLTYAWRGAEALINEALAVAEANFTPKDISGDSNGL